MITQEKLAVCISCGFNTDYWIRTGIMFGADVSVVTDQEFALVGHYVSDVHLSRQGLATDGYRHASEARMRAACETTEVFDHLQTAAAAHWERQQKGPTFIERVVDFIFRVKR